MRPSLRKRSRGGSLQLTYVCAGSDPMMPSFGCRHSASMSILTKTGDFSIHEISHASLICH